MKKNHARRKQAEVEKERAPGAKRPAHEFFLPRRSSQQKQSEPSAAALLEESGAGKQSAIELSTNDGSADIAEGGGETGKLTGTTTGRGRPIQNFHRLCKRQIDRSG